MSRLVLSFAETLQLTSSPLLQVALVVPRIRDFAKTWPVDQMARKYINRRTERERKSAATLKATEARVKALYLKKAKDDKHKRREEKRLRHARREEKRIRLAQEANR